MWVHMRKEWFPTKRKSKIMARSEGLFELLEQIGSNAYKVDLLGDYGISADHRPYFHEDEDMPNLRSNSIQPGEDDGDHTPQPLETHSNAPNKVMESSLVKEVHVPVRNMLNSTDSGLAHSFEKWPSFVYLEEL